ncbi:hypothetical protein D3C76_865690 [compost metagenome]
MGDRGVVGRIVGLLEPAYSRAKYQGQRLGKLDPPAAIQTFLAYVVGATGAAAVRLGQQAVVVDVRAVVVDIEHIVVAGIEGAGEEVIGGQLGVVAAEGDLLLQAQALEAADHVHVHTHFGGVEIRHPVGIGHTAAIEFQAVAGGLHALVGRGVGFAHAHAGDAKLPVVVEAVFEVGVEGGDVDFRVVPARAGEGRAGYVQRAAVDVARQAAQHGPRLGIGAADRQAEGGVFAQVEVEGAVQ